MSAGTLWVFPGQSSQAVGMGREAVERSARAAEFFTAAGEAIGVDLRELCWRTEMAVLTRTENVQPALTAVTTATWIAMTDLGLVRRQDADVFTGHSLGSLAAASAAGFLDPVDAVRLAAQRGRIMASAPSGGGMLEILTPDDRGPAGQRERGAALAERFGVDLAAVNGPTEIALAGEVARLDQAAAELGAVARAVPVSNAFHSRYMAPVVPLWAQALDAIGLRATADRHLGSTTVQVATDAAGVRADLVRALDEPVLWYDVLDRTHDLAAAAVVGPGRVMRRMMRSHLDGRPLRTFDNGDEGWLGS
ncbi:MAG TPA: ACP S-malonyltransferase [Cellulomonas sp.]